MNQATSKDIDNQIYDLLKASGSLDIFPTPVDKIVQYVELRMSQTDHSLHNIPRHYFTQKLDTLQRALRKIYGAFDRSEKVIYVNPSIHKNKKAFVQLHETGHAVIPWQKASGYFLDDTVTLDPDTKIEFEEEANYFASGALFQLDRFKEELLRLPLEIGSPLALAQKFGGSSHASMRRYVEVCPKKCALLVLEKREELRWPNNIGFRNCFYSSKFRSAFGELNWPEVFDSSYPFMLDYLSNRRLHKNGVIRFQTSDDDLLFDYHYFNNSHNIFILIFPKGEKMFNRTKIYLSSDAL